MTIAMQKDADLTHYATFGLKAQAQYLVRITSEEELIDVLRRAKETQLPVHFVGGGANTIFQEQVEGIVIINRIKGVVLTLDEQTGDTLVEVRSGEVLDRIIDRLIRARVAGLENLAGIPGTMGGAIVQNAGAYGLEIAEYVESVDIINTKTFRKKVRNTEECDFRYRHSIFKREIAKNEFITCVHLRIPMQWTPRRQYKEIQNYAHRKNIDQWTPRLLADAIRRIRAKKIPSPQLLGNAGSFFTNPVVDKVLWHKVLEKHPRLVSYPLAGGRRKFAAASLIEAAGLKGFRMGNAGMYQNHALIMVNHGNATATDVLTLAQHVQQEVYAHFMIPLRMEPVVVK